VLLRGKILFARPPTVTKSRNCNALDHDDDGRGVPSPLRLQREHRVVDEIFEAIVIAIATAATAAMLILKTGARAPSPSP
jgi:hypothetical protein